MTERQSYVQGKAGSLNALRLVWDELPDPAPGEVQVAVRAVGLNFADIFQIWRLYGATPPGPFIPGLEYAGEVIRLGEGVDHLQAGDQIYGVTRFGAYASHLNIDARYVRPLPKGWSFEQGAAYPVQVLTAYYALKPLGNLQPGQTVLIHSGAGGVGLWANRIAKRYDAFTIGTVGRPEKVDFLLHQEGYDRVILRDANQFDRQLRETLDGRDLHLVLESIGGKVFLAGWNQLAPQGRIVIFGSARYASVGKRPNYVRLLANYLTRPKIDPQRLIEDNKALLGFNLIWLYDQADLMGQLLEELQGLKLPPPYVGHTFTFEQLKDAIQLFQSGKTMGKVVVMIA